MFFQEIQRILASLGANPGKIDGDVGPKTIEAVKKVQAEAHLPTSGVIDNATIKILEQHVPADQRLAMRLGPSCQQIVQNYETLYDGDPSTVQLDPYICPAGVATIGWGHAILDEHGQQIRVKDHGVEGSIALGKKHTQRVFGAPGITKDQANQLLAADLSHFSAEIAKLVKGVPTTQQQYDAFGSCSFNIGVAGFSTSSILRLHKTGIKPVPGLGAKELKKNSIERAPIKTIEDAFCAWSRVSGVWTLGLFRRRFVECSLYGGGPQNVVPAIAAMNKFR